MTLTHRIHVLLWIVAQSLLACHAQAADASKSFAQVWRITGSVSATAVEPTLTRGLRAGDTVYVGEQLQAAANGEAVLRMEDGGYLAVRPGAQFRVEDFAADKSATDRLSVHLVQGGLRFITGWVAKLNPKGYRVRTPSATIGVRGTDHETYFLTDPLAQAWSQRAGTYDKVTSGQTYLETPDGSVDIAPGQVGFVRAPPVAKTRALITLLLPVVLDKVPEFFVPGQFDGELDQLSPAVASEAVSVATAAGVGAQPAAGPLVAAPAQPVPARLTDGRCNAQAVAQTWLAQLDGAMARRNAPGVLALFAADVEIRAVVADGSGGTRTVSLGRDEFAAGAVAALKNLSDYSQRRLSVAGMVQAVDPCETVSVTSLVLEQGTQSGKPYRFETVEEYRLVEVKGQWLATKALTRQP
ncbi:FecR domain-containing protein [Rhodoferax sp. AJA081-3]|uniref:FecR domain-containing protein n=1 Tax=Rhodoferax sp. AJA081-3 TaxID=2752316 RepID=UPI001AE04337|nr:FecR domain-containing protein [Rhodoferax sp. AJA081-3]QTN27997.1 FecR domain-containing protein [Rhodoferax sp. AJA081-3]